MDHKLFKQTLMDNEKPNRISFHNISVKNQKLFTNKITKNDIELLNDKRYTNSANDTFFFKN